jgi:hypothetical protein
VLLQLNRHLGVSAQGSQRLLPGACDRGRLPGVGCGTDNADIHRSFVEQPYRREPPVVAEIEQPHAQRCARDQGVANIRQCGDLAVGSCCEGNAARQPRVDRDGTRGPPARVQLRFVACVHPPNPAREDRP